DRDLKAALEVAPGPEQAGQNEVEQGPKLGEVVLDRRAAQKQAVARGELSGRHAREAQGVFDGLGFVQDDVVRLLAGEQLDVPNEQRITREQNVRAAFQHAPAFGAHERSDLEMRSE